jgi:N-methylhydantoinase B
MSTTDHSVTAPIQGLDWDGKSYPYRPSSELRIEGDLQFHSETGGDLDPITFEVLSNRMWNINEEHADTIQRVSGSPVVVHNYDFNTCIQTELGEPFLFAPYIQYFTGAAELIIKYTLENRAKNPGIGPGDIFISNDTLIAGSHQMDVAIYAPVFVGDRLFCWVFNACHSRDVGGVEPGGFCIQAPNHYYEAPALRAVKVADSNGIRADIEDTFLRFSRIPDMLALELRSQIAGVIRARTRMEELCEHYEPAVVKASMNKLLDDTEAAVTERLNRLPDGRWSEVAYFGGASPGDRDVHKMIINLEKRGDRLYFDNYGTDAQIGSINCGYGQFRAAIGAALAYMLAFDHRFCVGGVLRKTTIDAEVGTISAADRDGAISSTQAQTHIIFMAGKVLSKMMFPDPELRQSVMAASAVTSNGYLTHSGLDQHGQVFATVTLDHTAGGIGAFSFRDGIDQGGTTFWPKSEIPDVESYEQFFPVLYLYRRAARNCGHGKFRGGNGIAFAIAGHKTEQQLGSTVSVASAVTTESGLFGGHWGDTCNFYGVQRSVLRERFAAGQLIASPAELRALPAAVSRKLEPKVVGHPLGENDVIEEAVYGAGGYGDPIEREPARVARDVANGFVSAHVGTSVYGVELTADGAVDEGGTAARRQRMIAERLERAQLPEPWEQPADVPEPILEIAERLGVVETEQGLAICCTSCGHVLCDASDNYKLHSGVLATQLTEIDPEVFTDPTEEIDVEIVYRIFLCPACGLAFENELALSKDEPFRDIAIDVESVRAIGRVSADARATEVTT